MVVRVSLLCALLLAGASASWMDGDDCVDRPMGDLPDMPIPLRSTQPASVCASLCLNSSQCVAWAYSKASCDSESTPYCYLKSTVPAQSYDPCKVDYSSRRVET